jgi:curved DNA-binding protein CbpA
MAENVNFVDYYELLGLRPNATNHEIRRAYILKAKEHHPDMGGSIEMMQLLNRGYRTLTGATTKAAYDMLHSFHVGSTSQGDYRYADGREVNDVTDMSDDEVDVFLDNLLDEFRNKPTKPKMNLRQWFKDHF